MAFLCPMRIPRRKRKKKGSENPGKNGSSKTGKSKELLTKIDIGPDEEDDEFEPRKMIVMHDFIPCNVEDETPVKRNEHVKALYQENDWIYVVKTDGREGFVPFSYCLSEEDYEKRKDKAKLTSQQKNASRNYSVTLQDLTQAEFSKQNYGECVVKFDFSAIDEDDISVQKGEILVVLNKDDQDWLWVRKTSGHEGFVPRDFVTKLFESKSQAIKGLKSSSSPNLGQDCAVHTSGIPTSGTNRELQEINNNMIPLSNMKDDAKDLSPLVVYARQLQLDDSPIKPNSSNYKVIPLSSSVNSSLNRTLSPQPSTPVLPMSSLSDMESVLPASLSHVGALTSTFRNSLIPNETPYKGHLQGQMSDNNLRSSDPYTSSTFRNTFMPNERSRPSHRLEQQGQRGHFRSTEPGQTSTFRNSFVPCETFSKGHIKGQEDKGQRSGHIFSSTQLAPRISDRNIIDTKDDLHKQLLPAKAGQITERKGEISSSTYKGSSSHSKNISNSNKQWHGRTLHGSGEHVQSSTGSISLLSQRKILQGDSGSSKISKKEHLNFSSKDTITGPYSSATSSLNMASQRKNSNDLLINGQELVCTDTYIAQRASEMSVYKGDWVCADMTNRNDRGWIWAFSPSTKSQGFVPKYCLRPPATTPL